MFCSTCAHRNAWDARFCTACGLPLALLCRNCGATFALEANFCSACGQARNPTDQAPREEDGERRYATVVFSDLTGYTALNETTDPEVVEVLMQRIRRIASEVIERHGGTVNQFVGDEVMALFGVPVARRDDPPQAVRAVRELHGAVEALTRHEPSLRPHSLSMHSGVSSGLMIVRRSDSRAGHYAVIGDTVNSAARLRGLAAPGEIAVDHETWQQIADFFIAETSAPVQLEQLLLNVAGAEDAHLPGSIQALVQVRVDRLARLDKQALQAAAVLGQRWRSEMLAHLLEREVRDCQVLVEQALLRQEGNEYVFSHALIRDGAYASLLHTRRRHLHARAGEWFEARDLTVAAEHFERADDPRAISRRARRASPDCATRTLSRSPNAASLSPRILKLALGC